MKYNYHIDGDLPHDEIFVFGSNLAGRHGAGAALIAAEQFGAEMHNGFGPMGESYAVPTKDANLNRLSLSVIMIYVEAFKDYAEDNPDLDFFVTRVGCGLAGNKDEEIAPFFINSPTNCNFVYTWAEHLEII